MKSIVNSRINNKIFSTAALDYDAIDKSMKRCGVKFSINFMSLKSKDEQDAYLTGLISMQLVMLRRPRGQMQIFTLDKDGDMQEKEDRSAPN